MNYINKCSIFNDNHIFYGFIGKNFPFLTHWNPSDKNTAQYRTKICADIGRVGNKLVLSNQQHTNNCIMVNNSSIDYSAIVADAMVTKNRKYILAVRTADCVPILLYDREQEIMGIIHAGWKGALAGIIANTMRVLQKMGSNPKNIKAIIGPAILQKSYEVGSDFYQQFSKENVRNSSFFLPQKNEKYLFNLIGFVKDKLALEEVAEVIDLKINTYGSDDYYSYRYAFHQGRKLDGHILSFIGFGNAYF